MLRKIRTVPDGRQTLNRVPRHETPRSNALFETKHRPLAAFQGLPSWEQSVAHATGFCENKIPPAGSVVLTSRLLTPEYRHHASSKVPIPPPDTVSFSKNRERPFCLGGPGSR